MSFWINTLIALLLLSYTNHSPRGPLLRSQWQIVTESDIFFCPLTLQVQ